MSILRWLVALLLSVWRAIHIGLLLLKPARFSLIMVIGGLLFLASDQGADTLRDFAERKADNRHDTTQTVAFWVGAFFWAYGSWFWARVLSKIRLGDGTLPDTRCVQKARIWIPRIIGAAAILGLAFAFHRAAAPYASATDGPGEMLKRYAWYSVAGGVVFLLFVIFRRDLSPKLAPYFERLPGGAAFGRVLRSVRSTEQAMSEFGTRGAREVVLEAGWLLGASLAITLALFMVFAISPEEFGPRFGSTPILLLAAAGWIACGSAVDLFAMVQRFPVWIGLFGVAIAFSVLNDNHAVRTVAEPTPQPWAKRQTVAEALESWKQFQQKRPPAANGEYPLLLVAAEGGGIRAAYWTASVLAEIQDRYPCFSDRLFAMSGVSGGSLGVAMFDALAVEDRGRAPDSSCASAAPGKVRVAAEAMLNEDFLSPAIAAMLFPDLLQRVLPVPVSHFDRARALEVSWERAWQRHAQDLNLTRTARFADVLDDLWRGPPDRWTPALLLNSTVVETGKRLITSNLRLTPDEFADVEDTNRFYEGRALPLSAAVHLSARFTYVSPAGTLVKDGKVHGRAVDGGYFENSGLTAVLEILDAVDQAREQCGKNKDCAFWNKVKAVAILISNEPSDDRYLNVTLATDPDKQPPALAPSPCCNEVWSPLRALLATRGARGIYARETVYWRDGVSEFLHFGLCRDPKVNIPLGWTLSKSIQDAMKAQLLNKGPCLAFDNPKTLSQVARWLK